jgi:transcriptional regulator
MRSHPFAVLVSPAEGTLVGTHLPFMFDEEGPHGTLLAHMARANPHWKSWTSETEVMVIFGGPHAYISPGWYEDRVTVPTWNYAVVHAYGRPRIVTEPEEVRHMVFRLTRMYEPETGGWDVAESEPVLEAELKGIVAFTIPIDRIEGKFKFNQNRSRADQEGAAKGLRDSSAPMDREVSAIMERNLKGDL